jgi:lysophospholipase L1-like esterase
MSYTILCYGDSNTWGYDPITLRRFDRNTRWPGVLRTALGSEYEVIEEGLGGRTTIWDDPIEGHKNGATYLPPCLQSHQPLDLVIVMLGTNDLKHRFGLLAEDIGRSLQTLCEHVTKSTCGHNNRPPRLLIVSPVPFAPLAGTALARMFTGGEEKSRELTNYYREVARVLGADFFDAGTCATASPLDAIHLNADAHQSLGLALAKVVQNFPQS